MEARIFEWWSVISFFHIWFVIIWSITSGDKSPEKWFVYPLSTFSMEATEFVYFVSHQSHWPCWPAIRILVIWPNSGESYDFFLILFSQPKYLWTRDIYCKDEGRWPAALLKTPLVHRNSSHICLVRSNCLISP